MSGFVFTIDQNNTKATPEASSGWANAQETQNFANWFQYARSRVMASKSVFGTALSNVIAPANFGLWTINRNLLSIPVFNRLEQLLQYPRTTARDAFSGWGQQLRHLVRRKLRHFVLPNKQHCFYDRRLLE